MHSAYLQLGNQATDVTLLAVTVDPENDTVDQVRAFSDQHGLTDEWHFVTGTRPQLEAVWRNFGILAQPVDPNGRPVSPATRRALEGLPATPDQLSHDLRVLLGER
jgi:cytochrome oxidase Cu insertion factor (SCO1/SenC/PrrC family)